MRFICILLLLAVAANAIPTKNRFSDSFMRVKQMRNAFNGRIVGGEVVEPNSIPFQVSFQTIEGIHFCGGSIINEETVVTAAHCCTGHQALLAQIVAGEHDLSHESGNEQKVNIEKFTFHEMFGTHGINNDICLLKLSSPLKLNSKVQPIALPEKDQKFTGDVVASGWGSTATGGAFSPLLRAVTVQIVSDKDCEDVYGDSFDESMICAAAPGKDSCQGDSGGPLVQDGTLVGIVSWRYACADPNFLGVYGNVPKFIDWIERNI